MLNHGDFLLRDSQSSLGNFVLTSHWKQKTLHFLIRKTVVQSSETYTRVQYSLEDEAFDSVPALVHFYVGSKAALTQWSGAQIHRPVNRTLPLSYLETAFCTAVGPPSCQTGLKNGEESVCPRRSDFTENTENNEKTLGKLGLIRLIIFLYVDVFVSELLRKLRHPAFLCPFLLVIVSVNL